MKLSTFFRLLSSFVIGGTLSYRGIHWYQPSFWIICIAAAVYSVAVMEDHK
jgi:hypothetical protein